MGYKRRDDGGCSSGRARARGTSRVEANQVTWTGTKPGASSQGTSPGNGFVDLAFPVEYKTRNATVEGGYNTRAMHFDLSWMASKFENDNESFTWTNGYFGNGTDRTYLAGRQPLPAPRRQRDLPRTCRWARRSRRASPRDELKSSIELGTSVLSGHRRVEHRRPGPASPSFNGKVEERDLHGHRPPRRRRKGLDTRALLQLPQARRRVDARHVRRTRRRRDRARSRTRRTTGASTRTTASTAANRIGGGYDYLDTEREGRHDFDRTKDKRFFAEWQEHARSTTWRRASSTRGSSATRTSCTPTTAPSPNDSAYLNRFVTAFDLSNVEPGPVEAHARLHADGQPRPRASRASSRTTSTRTTRSGRLKDDRREIYVSASYGVPGGARFTVFGDSEEVKYDSHAPRHRLRRRRPGAYDPSTPPNAQQLQLGRQDQGPQLGGGHRVRLAGDATSSRSRPRRSTTRPTATWTSRCRKACPRRSRRRSRSPTGTTRSAPRSR